jgi:hypothetical protein
MGDFSIKVGYAAEGQEAQDPSFGQTCGFGPESFE